MSAERWLPVPGYEGRYDISDHGRLRSWIDNRGGDYRRSHPVVITGSVTIPDGYRSYCLSDGVRRVARGAHQWVLLAFIGPRPENLVTRHRDGDPQNNNLSNLCYGTQAENVADILRHGRHPYAKRTHCNHGHAFTPDNILYQLRPSGKRYRKCRECQRLANAIRIAQWSAERRAAKESVA